MGGQDIVKHELQFDFFPLTSSAFSFFLSHERKKEILRPRGYLLHPLCLNSISIPAFRSLDLNVDGLIN